jgi:hypothetical protein
VVGRFLSEDPIGFNGDNDFYRYVRNSPIDLVDPLGLQGAGTGVAPAPVQQPGNPIVGPGTGTSYPGPCVICVPILILLNATELNGGEQGWIQRQRERERECAKAKWRCRVRCALINIRTNSAERYVETDGYGPTEGDAFYNGQKQLQNSTPPGFRTKHCHVVGRCEKR